MQGVASITVVRSSIIGVAPDGASLLLPKTIDEEDLHNMFAPYGELREVHIIRGPEGTSKGCAFVKFVDRDAAMVAIENVNELIPPVSFFTMQSYNSFNLYLNMAHLMPDVCI